MTLPPRDRRQGATTIRIRLGVALAIALIPVLILSALQSALTFERETGDQRANLSAAAERSAATARARIEASEVLLETLANGSLGYNCPQRLGDITRRTPGYANLVRFDATGRVVCSAATVPPDAGRRGRAWFADLERGARVTVVADPGSAYSGEPALLAAVRAEAEDGAFDGALVALIKLSSLRPEKADRSLPPDSEVALIDQRGDYLSTTRLEAFPASLRDRLDGGALTHSSLWFEHDRAGALRVFTAAPLVGRNVYVVLSAPSQGLVTWAWLNPLTSLALPILAFLLALLAVLFVAERGVVRWIAYLQRIAAIYARGRFSVHPVQAERAPPEIRDLAETLDAMATTIAARDASLHESIAHKDALMREIHHRVKNNLQIITSLLNMQQRALADPAARAAMSDTRQRVSALALIYRALYQGGPDLQRVDLREFLDELVAQLITGETSQGLVRAEVHVDPLIIDPDRLGPLALFAVEAITNAKKHGLSATGGLLTIRFTVNGADAELMVADTGRGAAPAVVGKGVGRTLMTAFARQLRGDVEFRQNEGGGLTVRLVFPTPDFDEDAARRPLGRVNA